MSHPVSPEHKQLRRKWIDMKRRCFNSERADYERYGAKGIVVCDRWLIFENFLEDMLPTYKQGLTIDRIDSDGNYEPSNCRWATDAEQRLNKSTNHLITFNGITQTLKEWSEQLGIKSSTLRMRISTYGWPVEKALTGKRG